MNKILLTLSFSFIFIFMSAQNTVGLLSYNPSVSYDGYNLLYPHNQPHVYLLDNCGEIVHVWEGEPDTRPGNTAYLLEDGRLIKSSRPASVANDPIWAGGGGATIEIRDWDNTLLWSFTQNDTQKRLHHDFTVIEKNGTLSIAMIAWELKTEMEAWNVGRDTTTTVDNKMWPDYILEINPANDEVIWEWHAWDHLIQDIDPTRPNYGVISDNPQRIDINYDFGNGVADWMHSNALDYDPVNDMLVLCVPTFHEIWVIDHTTSTAQAAGNVGGNGGRGGDLLYRWGNPAAYKAGDETDQKLFYPHDAHWINDHLQSVDPHFGKLAVFNNRVGEDYSTFNIINSGFDMYDWDFPFNGQTYDPVSFDVTEQHPIDSTLMWSTGLSSFQVLPNGNYLIEVGRFGYAFEMTSDTKEIVWEYKTPINGGAFATQGDSLSVNNNLTFRIHRYPTDFPAFIGKDLTPSGWLELEPDTEYCDLLIPTNNILDKEKINIYPNPASKMVTIEWEAGKYIDMDVYDMLGRKIISSMRLTGGRKYLDTSEWVDGMYFVVINNRATLKLNVMNEK